MGLPIPAEKISQIKKKPKGYLVLISSDSSDSDSGINIRFTALLNKEPSVLASVLLGLRSLFMEMEGCRIRDLLDGDGRLPCGDNGRCIFRFTGDGLVLGCKEANFISRIQSLDYT